MNNLHTLENVKTEDVSKVLAAAALLIAPDPGDSSANLALQEFAPQADLLIKEYRERLGLKADDLSQKATKALSAQINKGILDSVFGSTEKIRATTARVGQKGGLPNSQYEIDLPKPFSDMFLKLGFTRQSIKGVINSATETQHLSHPNAALETRDDVSLFLQRSGNHWKLVQTQRVGAKLIAQSAWLIFPTMVDLSHAENPLGVLQAFVEQFGVMFKIGNESYKFITSAEFPGIQHFGGPPRGQMFMSFAVHTNFNNIQTVLVAYCIDMMAYRTALRRAGVNLPIETGAPYLAIASNTT